MRSACYYWYLCTYFYYFFNWRVFVVEAGKRFVSERQIKWSVRWPRGGRQSRKQLFQFSAEKIGLAVCKVFGGLLLTCYMYTFVLQFYKYRWFRSCYYSPPGCCTRYMRLIDRYNKLHFSKLSVLMQNPEWAVYLQWAWRRRDCSFNFAALQSLMVCKWPPVSRTQRDNLSVRSTNDFLRLFNVDDKVSIHGFLECHFCLSIPG